MSWASQRKAAYFGGVFALIALAIGVPLFIYFNRAPSCTDAKQNGGEQGVDCGGSCKKLCTAQTKDLVILWNRAFRVADGAYDVLAMVTNPNLGAGLQERPL